MQIKIVESLASQNLQMTENSFHSCFVLKKKKSLIHSSNCILLHIQFSEDYFRENQGGMQTGQYIKGHR